MASIGTASSVASSSSRPEWRAGEVYASMDGYIEYHCGSLPIVISVPHGGYCIPSSIPDRTIGNMEHDDYTQELALELNDAFAALTCINGDLSTGHRAHMIMSRIVRRKIDFNRECSVATQDHPLAVKVWHEYHAFIETARQLVAQRYGDGHQHHHTNGKTTTTTTSTTDAKSATTTLTGGNNGVTSTKLAERGLFIDFHGQGADPYRVQLGYGIEAKELWRSNSELDRSGLVETSCLSGIWYDRRNVVDEAEDTSSTTTPTKTKALRVRQSQSTLLRGATSLGGMLQACGYACMPSPAHPNLGKDVHHYFLGGHNVYRHGLRPHNQIEGRFKTPAGFVGVQMEINRHGIRDSAENRARFVVGLATSLLNFAAYHFGWTPPSPLSSPSSTNSNTSNSSDGSSSSNDNSECAYVTREAVSIPDRSSHARRGAPSIEEEERLRAERRRKRDAEKAAAATTRSGA
jgi:hypothetical protein